MHGNSAFPVSVKFGSAKDEDLLPCDFQNYSMNRKLQCLDSSLVPWV